MLNERNIRAYEAKGAHRWTKGNHDRLYIDAKLLGLECECYNTGNIKSATWCGERISNSDARRIKGSSVYIDVNTGELHVDTTFYVAPIYDIPTVKEAAEKFVEQVTIFVILDPTCGGTYK